MYTEFGLDRLRFAGLIPERLIYLPKKSIQYRLSAYNNIIVVFTLLPRCLSRTPVVPVSCANVDWSAGRASPLHACNGGGII